jgi:hypothetical protein
MFDWTALGSVATGLAFFGVVWQAWETRKTAGQSRKTVEIASASLETSRETLQINRDVVLEAVKARLDSRAPRLKLFVAPTNDERARQRPSVLHTEDIGAPWPMDREFRRDEDNYQQLTLGAQFEIENEGVVTAEVTVSGSVNWLRPPVSTVRLMNGAATVSLAPGQRCEFRIDETQPLQQWAEAWQARSSGNVDAVKITAAVVCSDAFDDGVIDSWQLEMWCYPVEPRQGDRAAWLLRPCQVAVAPDPPVVAASIGKQRREYFFSKEENRKIP